MKQTLFFAKIFLGGTKEDGRTGLGSLHRQPTAHVSKETVTL